MTRTIDPTIASTGERRGFAMLAAGAALAVGCLAMSFSTDDNRYLLHDLGTLGGMNSMALDVNSHGAVVGWSETLQPVSETHGFIWLDDTMTDLGTLGGGFSQSLAVNDAGEVVGQAMDDEGRLHAFHWFQGTMIDLNDVIYVEPVIFIDLTIGDVWGQIDAIDVDGIGNCWAPLPTLFEANAISQDGHIVAGGISWEDTDAHAFLLSPFQPFDPAKPRYTYLDLGRLPGAADCIPWDVSDTGYVVGQSGNQAFIWFEDELVSLENNVRTIHRSSSANAVNDAGHAVGWTEGPHAGLWQDGYRIDLGAPRGWISEALDVNVYDVVVGWASEMPIPDGPQDEPVAMLWEGCIPYDLNLITDIPYLGPAMVPWGRLEAATAVSDSDYIVGFGRVENGYVRAFLLTPLMVEEEAEN